VLAIVLVGAKAAAGALFGPDKTINRFITAVQSGDAEALRKSVVVTGEDVELTDESAKAFMAGYGSSDRLTSIQKLLMEDAAKLDNGLAVTESRSIRLAKKSYGLFSVYSVEITPVPATFFSEFDNVKLTIAGEEYTIGHEGTHVLMIPGLYSGSASYTDPNTGAHLETTLTDQRISAPATSANKDYATANEMAGINVTFDYVYLYVEGASQALTLKEIYIDGNKYTGSTDDFTLYGGFSLGPLNYESKVKVVAEAFGLEFEREVDLSVEDYCYIDMAVPDSMKQEAIDTAAKVMEDWIRYFYSYDEAALGRLKASGLMDEVFNSSNIVEIQQQDIEEGLQVYYMDYAKITVHKEKGYADVGVDYDRGYVAYVTLPVTLTGTSGIMDFSTGIYTATSDEDSYVTDFDMNMIYKDGKWIISNMDGYTGDMDIGTPVY